MPADNSVLDVLERQLAQVVAAKSSACDAVRGYWLRVEQLEKQEYAASRLTREHAELRAQLTDNLRSALAADLKAIAHERDQALEEFDVLREARASDRRELRDLVDVEELRSSDDPAHLRQLVADAEIGGGEVVGAEARRIAVRRLKELAGQDQRHHRLKSVAFEVLCEMTVSGKRGVGRADVVGKFEQRGHEVRRLIGEIASVAGIASLASELTRTTPMPQRPTQKATLVVGPYWEALEERRRQQQQGK